MPRRPTVKGNKGKKFIRTSPRIINNPAKRQTVTIFTGVKTAGGFAK